MATLSAPARVALATLVFALFALLGRAVSVGWEGLVDGLRRPTPAREASPTVPDAMPGSSDEPPTMAFAVGW